MKVFKVYFLIMRKKIPTLIIFLITYIGLLVFYNIDFPANEGGSFEDAKIRLSFLSYDITDEGKNTEFVEGLKNYLSEYSEIVIIDDDKEKLEDAFFSEKIHYAVRIPSDFTKNFFEGNNAKIERMSISNLTQATYADMHINKYLNRARLYKRHMAGISEPLMVEKLRSDLSKNVDVEVSGEGFLLKEITSMTNHYNLLAYYLLFILTYGAGINMMAFNRSEIIKRNNCSPISMTNRNFQLLLANLTFAVFCWIIGILTSFIFYTEQIVSINSLLLVVNSFVLMLTTISISFFIGSNIKNKEAFYAITNVLVLGMCFLSGIFIPQDILGPKVIEIARFLPTYWFVKNNIEIQALSVISTENLLPIISQMLIILCFGIGVLIISLLISKLKLTKLRKS